mgnify:CR=1 FL=1
MISIRKSSSDNLTRFTKSTSSGATAAIDMSFGTLRLWFNPENVCPACCLSLSHIVAARRVITISGIYL